MFLFRTLLLLATTLTMAACSSVDLGDPTNAGAAPSTCNADKASHVTGKRISVDREQEALHSSGASTIRVIRPGQAITKDYRAERLNLQLNDYDVVVRAYCG